MSIQVLNKELQTLASFNNGEILEYKPIGFPHEQGGLNAYSNLFYWASAFTERKSRIGLHAHKGYEIMTLILKGNVNHYDTKTDNWLALEEGSAQVINAGSGISHSEELGHKTEVFQIWFDPDLKKTLKLDPSYKDYSSNHFEELKISKGFYKTVFIGDKGPIHLISEHIQFSKYRLLTNVNLKLDADRVYSLYIYSGELILNGKIIITRNSFIKICQEQSIYLKAERECVYYLMENQNKQIHI